MPGALVKHSLVSTSFLGKTPIYISARANLLNPASHAQFAMQNSVHPVDEEIGVKAVDPSGSRRHDIYARRPEAGTRGTSNKVSSVVATK